MADPPRSPRLDGGRLEALLRDARERFSSTAQRVGLAEAVRIFVAVARQVVERLPEVTGRLLIAGV